MLLALRSLYESLAVLVTAAGVAASPQTGTPSVKVTYPISGVVASPVVGIAKVNVTERPAGVSANAAIGAAKVKATFTVSGVAASPAIGIGTFDSNFAISGVISGANVGTLAVDVQALLSGVSANATIGIGSVDTPALGQVFVHLVGVSANAQIGIGTVNIVTSVTYPKAIAEGGFYRPRRARITPLTIPTLSPAVVVTGQGVRCYARNGKPRFNTEALIHFTTPTLRVLESQAAISTTIGQQNGVACNVALGQGNVETVIDLTDEEILTLMEAA